MRLQVVLAAALIGLVVSACGASPDAQAVARVITDSEAAAQNAMQGRGSLADVQQYFANTLEGGNIDTQLARHIAYTAFAAQPPGKAVRISNFTINAISVDSNKGEARVMYQMDIAVGSGAGAQKTTVTQNLLLVKTPARGWRIVAGDGATASDTSGDTFLGNLMGQ